MPLARSPTDVDVFQTWADKAARDIRVSLPCQVVAYDAGAQTVSVKPQVVDVFEDQDGDAQPEPIPVIVGVPVEWPSGGGMRITFPLAAGDTGRVVFCDRSIDDWLGLGSPADTAPADGRRHSLQDAVFTPGLNPRGRTWNGVSTSAVQIGQDGASMSAVALASEVDALKTGIAAFITAFTTFNTSLTAGGVPGALVIGTVQSAAEALATALTTLAAGPPPWPSPLTTGSGTVEILG